mgnify:CR=1 FL=1
MSQISRNNNLLKLLADGEATRSNFSKHWNDLRRKEIAMSLLLSDSKSRNRLLESQLNVCYWDTVMLPQISIVLRKRNDTPEKHGKGSPEKNKYQAVFLSNWKLSERTLIVKATIQNQSRSYIPIITMIIWKMNNSESSQNQSNIQPRALIKSKPIFIHHFSNFETVISVKLNIIANQMKNIISERATSYSQSGFLIMHNYYQLPSIKGFQLWKFNSESLQSKQISLIRWK